MKKELLLALLCSVAFIGHSQIKVNSNGNVAMGGGEALETLSSAENQDSLTTLTVYGYGKNGTGGRIAFGNLAPLNTSRVMIGEVMNTKGKLWLQGSDGVCFTTGNYANDTVFSYSTQSGKKFNFNCNVQLNGLSVASDQQARRNVATAENVLPSLNQVQVVNYATHEGEAPQYYGIDVNSLQESFPGLVQYDAQGNSYIDYASLVPVLLQSIKELQTQVSAMLGVDQSPRRAPSSPSGVGSALQNEVGGAKLYQNTPNPFISSTEIRYSLPQSVVSGTLAITDMQGKVIEKIELKDRGEHSVTLQNHGLVEGLYMCSLIADGKVVETRKMILSK